MSAARGLPFLQFFPGDWLSDERLRMCSLAAQGLWIGLLCYAHRAGRRGYIEIERAVPITDAMLARLFATSTREIVRLKSELLAAGVPSVEEGNGVWYSRRMVRDEQRRTVNSANGRLGGNPTLKADRLTDRLTDPDNQTSSESDNHGGNAATTGADKLSLNAESETDYRESETDLLLHHPSGPADRAAGITWSAAEGWSGVTESDREAWLVAYPAVDIERQLAAAGEWLKANPAKAKKRNFRRFIVNWLSRSQERGGGARSQPQQAARRSRFADAF